MTMRDIFLCHASEDKPSVVCSLARALAQAGISCWYDEAEIRWGESITQKVNEGLRVSRYVIVVLSAAFLAKHWPQRELYAALNLEASSGEVKVLPLLVGSDAVQRDIIQQLPFLNDKRYLSWGGRASQIIEALQPFLGQARQTPPKRKRPSRFKTPVENDIPMPKIRKQFSQREKDAFLKESFQYIILYFQQGLSQLERQYQEVETAFDEIHNYKFICTIYVDGETRNRCKIWLGGMRSSNMISYYEDHHLNIDNDTTFNDWLTVEDDGFSLYFRPGNTWYVNTSREEKLPTTEQAAAYLWQRFSHALER